MGEKPQKQNNSQCWSKASMPRLPVELWSSIFDFATHIPGALEIDDHATIAAFARDQHGICLSNRFKSAMQSKLSFSMVCKHWNAIVQSVLFQHLQITSGEHACAIARALNGISRGKENQEGPGKWTLRIGLVMEGVHAWLPRHTRAMSRVFESCPNLLCLSIALPNGDRNTPMFIQQLGRNTGLKRMEVQLDDKAIHAINAHLSDKLQVLWLKPYQMHSSPFTDPPQISMPNLRVLVAAFDISNSLRQFILPNLRACILDRKIDHYPAINNDAVVYLSVSTVRDLNLWPNLTTISVSASILYFKPVTWQESLRHAKIEWIIIEDIDFKRQKFEVWLLEENLSTFLSPYRFPSLRGIKFLFPITSRTHQPYWFSKEERPFWCVWFQACKNCGVQIEVSEGAMEWTEDRWTQYCHDEVVKMLGIDEEDWLVDEGLENDVED